MLADIPTNHAVVVCGDFNARTAVLSPQIDGHVLPRVSPDMHTCARAPWLIATCEQQSLHILNGTQSGSSEQPTFHRQGLTSVVDYVLARGPHVQLEVDSTVLGPLSDHSLLVASLRLPCARPQQPAGTAPAVLYKWDEGTSVRDYADGANTWGKYTSEPGFISRMQAVTSNSRLTNEQCTTQLEQFLLAEAI
jgi:hypothetical protein